MTERDRPEDEMNIENTDRNTEDSKVKIVHQDLATLPIHNTPVSLSQMDEWKLKT